MTIQERPLWVYRETLSWRGLRSPEQTQGGERMLGAADDRRAAISNPIMSATRSVHA